MLDDVMAQKLIDRLSGTLNYNVNVMDTSGIIIASYDLSRVGSFHETAFRMIRDKKKMVEVKGDKKMLGTRPGINMVIENKNEVVGIVGITGDPDTVRPIALLLKASIESLLEFELQQQALMSRTSKKDRFFQQMIYREDRDQNDLETLATGLGYRTDSMRISIYVETEPAEIRDEVAHLCKANDRHTKNDMLIRTESGNTLIFLSLKKPSDNHVGYREEVELYLDAVEAQLKRKKIRHRFLVGSMQDNLMMYRDAYLHCRWMKSIKKKRDSLLYFYDYVEEFFNSRVPYMEKHHALDTLIRQQDADFWENYVHIFGTMLEYNNNMVKASKALHMHKNTLVYKFNQIREALNINPLENAKDNQLARQLCYYMMQK